MGTLKTKIRKMGNSRGVTIPATLIQQLGFTDEVELRVQEGGLLLKPVQHPRAGWAEALREMAANGEDELILPDVFEDEDLGAWE